jgi:integrase
MPVGNWLSAEQGKRLLRTVDVGSLRGKRDYATLAILLGCGLRRAELTALRVEDIQQREEHWVIADLIGKGGHIRTIPVPDWVKAGIDAWMAASGIAGGILLRSINKAGRVWGCGFSPKVIWGVVKEKAKVCEIPALAPHDLRRYAECRIMPNRNLNHQDVGWPGIISGELIRHNRGRLQASQKTEKLIIRLVTKTFAIRRGSFA